MRKQQEGESINDFLSALLIIVNSEHMYLETALRNQLVFGLRSGNIEGRLLECKNLTLERALATATSMEMSAKSTAEIKNENVNTTPLYSSTKQRYKHPFPPTTRVYHTVRATVRYEKQVGKRCFDVEREHVNVAVSRRDQDNGLGNPRGRIRINSFGFTFATSPCSGNVRTTDSATRWDRRAPSSVEPGPSGCILYSVVFQPVSFSCEPTSSRYTTKIERRKRYVQGAYRARPGH
ncbi:hypothetical protein Trydic_g5855 [Trypoxylus dichotomus]